LRLFVPAQCIGRAAGIHRKNHHPTAQDYTMQKRERSQISGLGLGVGRMNAHLGSLRLSPRPNTGISESFGVLALHTGHCGLSVRSSHCDTDGHERVRGRRV
jgi:hypothetical protein